MKNFLQVNRASLGAKKNFYLNLNQLPSKNDGGQSCDGNRQSKVMLQSGCSAVDVLMTSYGASDEHPMSTRSASDERRWKNRGWKYVAMIVALLTLSIGQMWGTDFTFSGVYNGTGNGTWNTTTSTTPIVTVSKSIGSGPKTISCVSGRGVSYPTLNGASAYIKFAVPAGYRITNVNVKWMSNTDGQKIIAIFGQSISDISSSLTTATYGGHVASSALASKGNTSCDGGHDLAISASHNAREVMLVRQTAYKDANTSGNTKYASFPCRLGGTSGDYKTTEGAGSSAYIGEVVLTVESTAPSFSVDENAELVQDEDEVTLTSAGTTIYYKWSTNASAYAANAGSTLAAAADGSGASDQTVTAPNGTGTYYLYAVAKDESNNYSAVVKRSYTITAAAAGSTWYVKGGWNSWGTTTNLTGEGTTLTATATLSANTQYAFKVHNTSGDWHTNTGTIKGSVTNWDFSTTGGSDNNCYIRTSCAGTYTFTYNTSTNKLSVVYPESHKVYFTKDGASWSKVYAYCYNDGTWNNGWPGVEITSNTEDNCGTEYYAYTNGYTYIIFNNGSGGDGNQTGNITVSGYEGKHAVGAAATGWEAYPTYTISYAANGGSSSMSSQTGIACGTDKATSSNTFTAPSGYQFAGWIANVDVTVGGVSKTAGTVLADGVTIENINSNITLTAQWEAVKYTVTYNVNGGGSVTPTSATQASGGASVNLPTPTWSGYTFEGWYNAGTKIGVGGASYTPTADITLYAHWTDNISGKVFSFIDNNYGDKFKSFTGYGWVAKDSTGRSKTFTNASTGVEYRVSAAGWDKKDNAISALAKFLGGTSSMSIVIPTGKIATVKISYNAYGTGDDYRLTVNSTAQANPSTKLADGNTNAQVISNMKEITLSSQTGTLTLGISNTGKNNYIGRVSAVITGYTVSYAAGTYGSGSLASGTKTAGSSFTLSSSSSAFTRSGYVYDGWSINEDGSTKDYNLGGSYTTDAAITLYPHWVEACSTPAAPTDFTAGSISATGATFTITDAADAASYDIYYSTESTAPTSGTDATTTSTSKTKEVTGLTAATTYYAWVRSVCDASHKSAWVALNPGGDTHTFATSCVAPTTVNVTATVNEVSGFWFYPDDDVVLTAAPTGSPAGSPVTYQWKKNGADIDGATSSTYTIDDAAASDAGKYTCTISYGACSTTSAEFELKCMQFYLKNSGGSDISNHALTKVDATHATLSLSLTGGTTYNFRVTDGCNNWYGNSDATGITSSNCSNWIMPHDADCKVTTSSKSATYTFNFDFSAGLLGSEMKVSVVYPAGDQAEGKVIYWDNNVLNWASAPWYRIGKGTHNNKTQMTLVPGTANLYKITTAEYNGFEYWHIANNEGEGTGNIFWTKDSDPATNEAITAAMGFEGSPVTADAVTFTPTSSHATGSSSDNDNCEFYEYGQQNGMKTDRVTISDYSNGTITVNYVDTDEEAASFTSGYADLAHSVILTSITAVADEGYDASAITINDGAYSANYVVTGNTTIAASFTLKAYTISYNKGTNGTGSKASETKTHGVNFTLPGSTFTYGGHAQDGWSTSDGGALAYALSGSYTTNAAQEFFPHWKCNTPEISCSSNTITISVPTGATVYYTTTTDGSTPADPTSSSTAYNPSSKPTISADTKIKAIAIQSGCTNSDVASASLTYEATGTTYYLFDPTNSSVSPVHTGTLSGDFITANSVGDGTAQTIGGYEFSKKSVPIGGSTLTGTISNQKAGDKSIDYDVKSTSTTFYLYVSGANNTIYMHKIRESGYTTDSIVSQSTGAATGVKLTFTLKSKENTRVCFSTGSTSIRCYQIVAVESGTALPQACEEGYELNFDRGRYAYVSSGGSNLQQGAIDGLSICSHNSYKYKYTSQLELTKNTANTYISFTTGTSACAVKVTFSQGTLILNTSQSTSGGVSLTSNTAANLAASTTYYIVNTNASDRAYITKIAFEETAAVTYTLTNAVSPAGYGTLSHASVSSIPSGTTTSSSTNTYTVNGTTVTATPADATAEYTYAFDSWSGLPATVTADATVTANFTRSANSYILAWSSNGGSDLAGDYTNGSTAYGASITAPNDPTLSNYTFDGWNTANDGSGTTAGATMPAANTTYYAAWKQTVTLTTGAQGSGSNQTPVVYLNGTSVSDFTAHTATGYTLQGYYTAGSGGVKVLNANGTFAAANVTDYITSSKWSRTGAAPTLFAQWVASEDCRTLKYVWKVTGNFCDDQSTATSTVSMISDNDYFTLSGTGYKQESGKSLNLQNTQNNYFLLTAKTGYQIKSICFYGKVQDSSVDYTTDNSTWTELESTKTDGDDYYSFNNINASHFGIKLTAATPEGIWIRNMVIEVCAAGGTTYSVTYDGNDETGGTAPTDADSPYDYGTTVTVLGNTGSLAKTNYTFAGWTTNDDGTGSSYVADNTFSITANTTLYAKWTQTVTFDANTANHGSTGGSATAVWNATGLTGITHATPTSGYKLLGYYTAPTSGTKVLNSDGSFAATNVTGYITSGKWSRTSATTLYAEYESAGALTWNLIVNSDTANLSTSTKTSAFTEISTTNMTNATLAGDLTYEKSKKSALTGKISTPASYDADDYVYVTFQVASGYKFTPSSVKVKAQPVTSAKSVKLVLEDENSHSINFTTASTISGGSTQTVEMTNGSSVYFEGTVTLKIYCYGAADKYRLGTPITIEGEIEEACGTMPSYTSMSYTTTTFAPGADASGSPITIVGGDNINTYQWKYNKVNDRTSGTNCGTNNASLTPLTDAGATTDGTRYYWCEMTNTSCGITIKSPAVAITVAAAKSNATVTWTNPESTPNYGGGGYTIKATVDQTGWDGNAADLVITAPAGINIYNVTSGTTSSQKWVQADFDVQTSFDRSTYASNIPFTVSAAATATYNAISDDHNTAYSACSGGGEGSSYNIRVRKSYDKDASNNYRWVTPGAGEITYAVGSSISSGKAGTAMATDFDSIMSSDKQYIWVKTFVGNIKQMRLYVETSGANISVSALYQRTTYAAADAKDVITGYSVVYDEDDDAENTGTKGQHTIDLIFTSALSANDIICVKFSSSKVKALGAVITEGSAGSLNTYLQWSGGLANGVTVNKNTTDAYFTYSASKITENTNTLGAITYSSSNASVATVDATGKVALVAVGSTTIKATLAASGCYKKAEISYTLNVTEVACAITAGTLTLTSGTESKCSSANVTLTLTGFESGASIQWKDGDTDINNGGNYTIETDGTTSTLTTDQEGTYSVMVTSGCSVRSNRITISNKSTEVGAKRIVKNWYIKNGRLTPDIELWTLQNGAHLSSVAWDPVNATGLTASDFYESDGKVYLKGKEPSSNASGADIDYTLTLTVEDDCGSTTEMSASGQLIYLHHQKNTDKHVLAFVVTGTEKGEFTEGITAAQTTSVELYNTIAANFDVLATNVYSTDDEQALKEYYSQFDILCVTDYPNTGTKGVNKKSYVDALGALVDIRPILTMEAFVAKLANWKAKGISGTPQSPTTRQYTMLLQCKDHEIFSGTKLTKVGEGDETMYRVSMVDQTVEEYPTLDGYTPGSKDYNAGGKPALQGFTFTKEMLDDDLLPLGLIDDGSGNDLQVGIERQTEMEARLMVLGINSYAMERLTADGQTVVVNALKYLMKKNSEDIADCSNTFVGGDDEEDESTRSDWNVASHWSGNAVPDRTQKVRIVAPCVIKAGEKFHVTGVVIAPSGKYNHGANTASGSLTIAAGGALIVDGKVEAAKAPLYTETRATSVEDLTIQTSSTAQGALIFDNDKCETQATVELYSLGRKISSTYQYQYLAVPMSYIDVNPAFAGTGIYTYVWKEASGWERRGYYDGIEAFEGVGITTKSSDARYYTIKGTLASTETQEIALTYDNKGQNMIGNSWTAPIQISELDEDNTASEITKTVYIYCTGNGNTLSGDETETAGQWLAIPFSAAGFTSWTGLKVIPAMQTFNINVTGTSTLTLDYDKVVRGRTTDLNEMLRAPKRKASHEGIDLMRIRVEDSKTHTDLHLFEGEPFSDEFDNGWEAEYMSGDNRSAKLYADVALGHMAVIATDDLEGTLLGFAPGQETAYTFTFGGEGMGYYLNDLKLKTSTLIGEEDSYSFTYEEGDTNRFYISRTRIDAPQTTTGVTNLDAAAPKAQKFIYHDKMYIMVNGRVYSAEGQMVK